MTFNVLIQGLLLTTYGLLCGGLFFERLMHGNARVSALLDVTQTARLRWVSRWLIAAILMTIFAYFGRVETFNDRRWLWLTWARVALLITIVALIRTRAHTGWPAIAACVALLITQSMLSRSAQLREPVLPIFGDSLHIVLFSFWIGSVALLTVIVSNIPVAASPAVSRALSAMIDRFSPFAVFCVAGLLIGGVAQAGHFIGSLDELVSTPYGRALLAKLACIVLLIGFGAWHQGIVAPKLRRWALLGDKSGVTVAHETRQLRLSLLAETAVAIGLLLIVGLIKSI
jgi:putative copper export protein